MTAWRQANSLLLLQSFLRVKNCSTVTPALLLLLFGLRFFLLLLLLLLHVKHDLDCSRLRGTCCCLEALSHSSSAEGESLRDHRRHVYAL
jgi:hypothetical protein